MELKLYNHEKITISSKSPDACKELEISFGNYIYLNQSDSSIYMDYETAYKLALTILTNCKMDGSIN